MSFLRRPFHVLREILIALLLLIGSCFILDAQGDTMRMLAMKPPALADSAWRFVRQCSHFVPEPGGDLKDVHWFVADILTHTQHEIDGLWIPPDTIVLDITTFNYFPVIAHELLHQLMRGPPLQNQHPYLPFVKPCGLMPERNKP